MGKLVSDFDPDPTRMQASQDSQCPRHLCWAVETTASWDINPRASGGRSRCPRAQHTGGGGVHVLSFSAPATLSKEPTGRNDKGGGGALGGLPSWEVTAPYYHTMYP